MLKIIKYLKRSTPSILVIVMLLAIQAICDLALPDYTSNIVNVGIQQGGIEDAVPEQIRKSELETLFILMEEEDRVFINQYYTEQSDGIFTLNQVDEETIRTLNTLFSKPMMVVMALSQGEGIPEGSMIPEGMSVADVLVMMPGEDLAKIQAQMDRMEQEMPESMMIQAATAYVKAEYEAIGMDMGTIQNSYILTAGLQMLLIALVSMIATVSVGYLASKVAASAGSQMRGAIFRKVTAFSNEEMDKFQTASLITRSTNDIQQVQMLTVMLLRVVFYAPILAAGGFIKVLGTDHSMAWIIGVGVLGILTLVSVMFGVVMPKFKSLQKLVDRVNLVMREMLTGMLVIRAFSTEKHEEKRFDKANSDLTSTTLFVNRIMVMMQPLMMLIMNGLTVLIVWNGAQSVANGTMQVGNMMAFIQYTMQIIMSFLMISMVSIMLPRASVSMNRIDEVLQTDLSIKENNQPVADHIAKGKVTFNNVSFRYNNAEEGVLENITFTAEPGKTTAIIGGTGSGKSTLVNLIPRFYDVTSGEILIDGIDIKTLSMHNLREGIGYVPQKGVLFSGDIDSNLRYGKQEATEEELKRAATIAQAIDFIENKEEGFASPISQGGTNVSGGQKQRLSIARAIAKNPAIYIFDDSFSALDYKTDVALRKALKEETGDSTVIIVAQRISTILHADQIIVLDEGKIVGMGTHEELLKGCEVYEEIALSQLSKEELAHE